MFRDVFQGRCSYKLQDSNVIKKRPQWRCFPVNIANVFRTAFLIAFLVAV